MAIVTIHTAKTTLSQLLARVEAGEEIILSRGKEPIAKLVPFRPVAAKRRRRTMFLSPIHRRVALSERCGRLDTCLDSLPSSDRRHPVPA